MRHRMAGRKLGIPSDQRRALLRSLVSAVLWHEEIDTTEPRAKEAARIVDRVITLAKRNDIHSRRLVSRMIWEQNIPFQGGADKTHRDNRNPHRLLRQIFEEIAPLYRDTRGGYCRIVRLGPRRGDGAMMVRLELTKGVSLAARAPAARAETRSTAAPASRAAAPARTSRRAAKSAEAAAEAEPFRSASSPAPVESSPVAKPPVETTAPVEEHDVHITAASPETAAPPESGQTAESNAAAAGTEAAESSGAGESTESTESTESGAAENSATGGSAAE